MSQGPSGFDICLPGVLAGLTLAAVLLALGETAFPEPCRRVFPHQTLVLLSVAIGAGSTVGLVSLFFHSRGDEEKHRQHFPSDDSKDQDGFPLGGTDAF